jgi:hypothetical protein
MDALGIRPAKDIDLSVLPPLFERLRAGGGWVAEERYGRVILRRGDVELNAQLEWEDYPTTTIEAIEGALIIDGIPFMNLDELVRFKRALGREKDERDIALIEAYRSQRSGAPLQT